MSIINRLTTWTIGQILKAADLNAEFSNITNLFNNLDAATTAWTNVKGATINATSALQFNGTKTLNILQIISATTASQTAVTSNAFTAAGPSASITCHSTGSEVLILLGGDFDNQNLAAANAFLTIKRGSTDLASGSNGFVLLGNASAATGTLAVPVSVAFVDTPASVAALTYQAYIRNSDNATSIRFPQACTAYIFLFEIST